VGREEVGFTCGKGVRVTNSRRRQHKSEVGTATAQVPADCPGLSIYA